MVPATLLVYRVQGDQVVPAFLGEQDHPWLRALLDERDRFVGRRRRELKARLAEPLGVAAPSRKRALAAHVLETLAPARRRPGTAPRQLRAELFAAAAASAVPRDALIAGLAHRHALTPGQLEDEIFADLPDEQLVVAPDRPIAPVDLAARTNLALARGLLARASQVTIELEGGALPVVRHAKLRGLIVSAQPRGAGGAVLDISGPLALFHHTRLYGHALGQLLPLLAWCRRFRLEASCVLVEGPCLLRLATGDPIAPVDEPRVYDSRLEERFAREVGRAAPAWDVIRDPAPLASGAGLVFPDFALVHRDDPSRRWLVEIVGFWTPAYLARKLAGYRAADVANLVLCIDERRRCAAGDLPAGARVVWFRRHIDAKAVLAMIAAVDAAAPVVGPAAPVVGPAAPEVLDAVRAVAAQSRYGNAFVPLVEKRIGRRLPLPEIAALGRAGHVAVNRPTQDLTLRPLVPPRPPIAAELGAVRAGIATAIDAARRGEAAPLYHLVRERFDWLGAAGQDRLRPIVERLAAEGVISLHERGGRTTLEIAAAAPEASGNQSRGDGTALAPAIGVSTRAAGRPRHTGR